MKSKIMNTILGSGLVCMLSLPLAFSDTASGQDPRFEGQPTSRQRQRQRQRLRDPQVIRERLEQLEAELGELKDSDPDSPEITRLEHRVERLRGILERIEAGDFAPGTDRQQPPRARRPRGQANRPPMDPEEVQSFISQHPELVRIFETRPDGRPASEQDRERMFRRNRRKIEKIMHAVDNGEMELAEQLIASAELQFEIGQRIWQLRHAEIDEKEQGMLHDQLAGLVRRQVELELVIRELEIRKLEARLEQQRQELLDDRMKIDEVAASQLERILSGKAGPQGERRQRFRNRRFRAPEPLPREDDDL